VVASLLEGLKPQPGATPVLANEDEETLEESTRVTAKDAQNKEVVTRRGEHKVSVQAGVRHTFIVYMEERAYAGLSLFVDGKAVQQVERRSWFPSISFTPTKTGTVQLFVTGPDEEVNYTFLDYVWEVPKS
jgi:hypothetical protein